LGSSQGGQPKFNAQPEPEGPDAKNAEKNIEKQETSVTMDI
jgi:hypothetical protein